MKTLAMTLFLLSALLSGAQIPDADLDKISKADIIATLKHLQRNEQEAQARATEAELHEKATLSSLQTITRENMGLQTALDTAAKSADDLARFAARESQRADEATMRLQKSELSEAKQRGLAWKWRLMFFGLIAAVVALFIFKEWLKTIPIIGPIIASIL